MVISKISEKKYNDKERSTNMDFTSGGVTYNLGYLCFYSSLVHIDNVKRRNPPEHIKI